MTFPLFQTKYRMSEYKFSSQLFVSDNMTTIEQTAVTPDGVCLTAVEPRCIALE